MTTINNARDGTLGSGTVIQFANAAQGAAIINDGAVNVASASSLANALDIAVANMTAPAGNHADWFQYAGNTYVVEHASTGTAATALGTADYVVKLSGLVDLTNFADASGVNVVGVNGALSTAFAHAAILI